MIIIDTKWCYMFNTRTLDNNIGGFNIQKTAFSNVSGLFGGDSGLPSNSQGLFHVLGLLSGERPQRSGFLEQTTRSYRQDNREDGYDESGKSANRPVVGVNKLSDSERRSHIISGMIVIIGGALAIAGAVATMIWSRKV